MATTVQDPGATGIFTPEQEELRSSSRRFFSELFPSETVRRLMESREGFDQETWSRMSDLGWTGIAIPEEHGGLGFGFVELSVLLEEMGRRLVCVPFLSSVVMGATAISEAGSDEQKAELLPGIADGTTRASLALTGPTGRWTPEGIEVRATQDGGAWQLDGTASYVVDGATADLLVVAARTGEGVGLFAVTSDEGVLRTPLETLDMTRKQAQLSFEAAPAVRLGDGDATGALSRTLDVAAVALACEMVGSAAWCLETSSEYAKTRIQFGRPIGAFQAIKHKIADVLSHVEMARSAAYYAAWAVSSADEELPQVACMAKAYCSDALFEAAAGTVQVLGGIGFTWEHDAHLYLRRAKSSEIYLGDAAYNRELLATRLGV